MILGGLTGAAGALGAGGHLNGIGKFIGENAGAFLSGIPSGINGYKYSGGFIRGEEKFFDYMQKQAAENPVEVAAFRIETSRGRKKYFIQYRA